MVEIKVDLGLQALKKGLTEDEVTLKVSPKGLALLAEAGAVEKGYGVHERDIKLKGEYGEPSEEVVKAVKDVIFNKLEVGQDTVELTPPEIEAALKAGKEAYDAKVEEQKAKKAKREQEKKKEEERKRVAYEVLGDELEKLKREIEDLQKQLDRVLEAKYAVEKKMQNLTQFMADRELVDDFVEWLLARSRDERIEEIIDEYEFDFDDC